LQERNLRDNALVSPGGAILHDIGVLSGARHLEGNQQIAFVLMLRSLTANNNFLSGMIELSRSAAIG
jgi:hypothetical protein